jgi:hypothetical protein
LQNWQRSPASTRCATRFHGVRDDETIDERTPSRTAPPTRLARERLARSEEVRARIAAQRAMEEAALARLDDRELDRLVPSR